MGPSELAQAALAEGLSADGYPRRAERDPRLEAGAIERGRVHLDRDLARPDLERVAHGGRERRDLIRLEQARRTAADVDRAKARAAQGPALAPDLSGERFDIPLPQLRRRRRRREVAVRAARRAERDVHV